MTTALEIDVAVVGAGVAGLAAHAELRRAAPKLEVRVFEARDRIGGRILTVREPGLPAPIELGAEFVHGTAEETVQVAEGARLPLVDVVGDRFSANEGRLTRLHGFWHRLDKIMRRLDAKRTPDRSFQDFIDSRPGGRALAQDRALALEFIQGFHGADPARISERSLANGGSPGEDPNEQRMARVLDGYDRVPRALAEGMSHPVLLAASVSRVVWRPGHVRLTLKQASGAESHVEARAAIITVPLGVLLAPPDERGAIAFEPSIDRVLTHARRLTMGSIMRIVLEMRERFWEDDRVVTGPGDKSLVSLGFLHTRDPDVPVWWTLFPVRTPFLVGWAGGPRATRLLRHTPAELEHIALGSLARQLAIPQRKLRALLQRSWIHNWDRDPFARGAYSYVLVGGDGTPRRLAQPVDNTLYFAGEAADPEGRLGTVNGAISSGMRAARLCARRLSD